MAYDKFHVIQNVVGACDQVRKAESRSNAGKREKLERTRWMWLKNRVNWTEKETQKWESMALERCVTGMAYEMNLVLYGIYERKDAEEARRLSRNWCAWVHAMAGNWRTARADGLSCPDGRGSLEGDPGRLDSRSDHCLHRGSQQPVFGREAQSPWVPDGGMHDRHALLWRRETHPTVLLNY